MDTDEGNPRWYQFCQSIAPLSLPRQGKRPSISPKKPGLPRGEDTLIGLRAGEPRVPKGRGQAYDKDWASQIKSVLTRPAAADMVLVTPES
jgi:hypothetical protein